MEKEFLNQIVTVIQTVGFPVFVASWLLFRTDKRLDQNTAAMIEASKSLAQILLELQHGGK